MLKYAQIINKETKQCAVGVGTDTAFYKSIGMIEMDVEQAYSGTWYVAGFAPEKPAPTKDELEAMRRNAYIAKVDPITAHISRLQDGEQTVEVKTKIVTLMEERESKIAEIKERYPYPEN